MNTHTHLQMDLTKNQALVMNALKSAKAPLSAYTILDELREHGFRAPLQVYRALEKLVEFGLVHRIESLNAYIACRHPSCESEEKETILFTICEQCGDVKEVINNSLSGAAKGIADEMNFTLSNSVIELRGTCTECRST